MKKLFLPLLGLATLFATTTAQAQTQPDTTVQTPATVASTTPVKVKYLNVGVGLGAFVAGGIPLGASLEIGIKENISIGGFADYARYGQSYGGYKWHYNFVYVGARASYQLSEFAEMLNMGNKRIHPYAGASIGYRSVTFSDNIGTDVTYDTYGNGAFVGFHAGSRYYFTDKIGGFAEVGYGVSALKLGVTAKF